MTVFIFDCPCCKERPVLDLEIEFTPPKNIDARVWYEAFDILSSSEKEIRLATKFKKW